MSATPEEKTAALDLIKVDLPNAGKKVQDAFDFVPVPDAVKERLNAIGILEQELTLDPTHDVSLHEGPDKASDPTMAFCPHCAALVTLRTEKAKLGVM